jgi:hypothetical protein
MTATRLEQPGNSVSVQEVAGQWIVAVDDKNGAASVHTFDSKDFAVGYARAQSVKLWLEEQYPVEPAAGWELPTSSTRS